MTSWSINVSGQHRLRRRWPRRILMCLFMVCEWMFTIGESRTISHANDRQAQKVAPSPRPGRTPTSNSAWTTKEKTSTRNRGAEATSLSTAKATPTTRDRGTGDWNQRHIMIVHCRKPIPADTYRSKSAKFQHCITARRIIIFRRTAPGHICSLFLSFSKSGRRNNAKSAFQYTVNNNTT